MSESTISNGRKARRARYLLPFVFGITASAIGIELYSRGNALLQENWVHKNASAGDSLLDQHPFLPLFAFALGVIILTAITSLTLQIRSSVSESREQADSEKSSFARLATDTIRTPLIGVRWLTELLLGGDLGVLNAQQRESIQRMSKAVERTINLVSELLTIIKLSGGLIDYRPRETNLNVVVNAAMKDAKAVADTKQQKLVYEQVGQDTVISVDPLLIRHVFEVVLGNVLSLCSDGETVTVRMQSDDKSILVGIFYRGMGVDTKALEGDTEVDPLSPLVKSEVETQARINLTVSREILAAARGKIWTRNDKGEHAFFVALPRSAASTLSASISSAAPGTVQSATKP